MSAEYSALQSTLLDSFPHEHDLIPAPSTDLLCCLYTITLSMHAQHFGLPNIPTVEELHELF